MTGAMLIGAAVAGVLAVVMLVGLVALVIALDATMADTISDISDEQIAAAGRRDRARRCGSPLQLDRAHRHRRRRDPARHGVDEASAGRNVLR
jgi:hypothetical protein